MCDFGLSRFLGEGEVASTQDCGTCVYMAPEVFLNTKYTPSVDVYSYALVVWELITLQHPWADKLRGGTVFTVWDAVRREERPMVPTTMHPDLAQIICDCWKVRWFRAVVAYGSTWLCSHKTLVLISPLSYPHPYCFSGDAIGSSYF